MRTVRIADLDALAGERLEPTPWLEVEQARIGRFADATDDHQWIHVDPDRAARGPFGAPVAHGYLTLSLLVPLVLGALVVEDAALVVNYGANRVRFPAPVPAGSRIRARITVVAVERVAGGRQATFGATVEREGGEKPVCVAEIVFRYLA